LSQGSQGVVARQFRFSMKNYNPELSFALSVGFSLVSFDAFSFPPNQAEEDSSHKATDVRPIRYPNR